MKRCFIVIDGMDGTGKSSMVEMLHNYLFSKSKNNRILTTREPTMGTYGGKIRSMLAHDTSPKENADELLGLFVKDREEHLNNSIQPFLNSQKGDDKNIAICDRYYHSTIAFQTAQGIDQKIILRKNAKFLKPDITFILDISPERALRRMNSRKKEKFENLQFMEQLRKEFLRLPGLLKENIKIIDASKDKDVVFSMIRKEIDLML